MRRFGKAMAALAVAACTLFGGRRHCERGGCNE